MLIIVPCSILFVSFPVILVLWEHLFMFIDSFGLVSSGQEYLTGTAKDRTLWSHKHGRFITKLRNSSRNLI